MKSAFRVNLAVLCMAVVDTMTSMGPQPSLTTLVLAVVPPRMMS